MDMVGDGMFNEESCVGCDLDKRCVESHSTMKYNTSVFSPGNTGISSLILAMVINSTLTPLINTI